MPDHILNNGGILQETTEKSLLNQTAQKSNYRLSLCNKHGHFNISSSLEIVYYKYT